MWLIACLKSLNININTIIGNPIHDTKNMSRYIIGNILLDLYSTINIIIENRYIINNI